MAQQSFTNPRTTVLTFLAGAQAFHTLAHVYLSLSKKTIIVGHPAENLGIVVTRKVHAVAAVVNAAITIGLGIKAYNAISRKVLNKN